MASSRRKTTIFVNYATEDQQAAEEVYTRLETEGFAPWINTRSILAGKRWQIEIQRAIRECDIFVCLLSKCAVAKRGVRQEELAEAMSVLRQKLDDDIYIVPVRLEECEVPERLRSEFHYCDLFVPGGWDRLLVAIRTQEARLSPSTCTDISVEPVVLKSEKPGKAGYACQIAVPSVLGLGEFGDEVNAIFLGWGAKMIQEKRKTYLHSDVPHSIDDGPDTLYAGYEIGRVSRDVVSIAFHLNIWEPMAAHPYGRYESMTFSVPSQVPVHIDDLFGQAGIEALSRLCRQDLRRQEREEHAEQETAYEPDDQIERGTQPAVASFQSFVIQEDAFTALFEMYAVGPSVSGNRHVTIPLDQLREFVKPEWLHLWKDIV